MALEHVDNAFRIKKSHMEVRCDEITNIQWSFIHYYTKRDHSYLGLDESLSLEVSGRCFIGLTGVYIKLGS
jgi:hypothetical protein